MIIDDGKRSALWQMERDSNLIANLADLNEPLLRFYEWSAPCITYGYFIKPELYLRDGLVDFEAARRPTGGGLLFHAQDFPFTLALPAQHALCSTNIADSYDLINGAVLQALLRVRGDCDICLEVNSVPVLFKDLCMATRTHYDLLWNGIKIGGSAQRRTKFGLVHQGVIFLCCPPWDRLEGCLVNGTEMINAMRSTSSGIWPQDMNQQLLQEFKIELRKVLAEEITTQIFLKRPV